MKTRPIKVFALLITILAVLLVALSGCSEKKPEYTESALLTDKPQEGWSFDGEIKVGRVVPLTGALSSFGAGTPYVEQQAIEAVNELGGVIVDGRRCSLTLVYVDSESSSNLATEQAKQLISDGVDIMIVSNSADTVPPVSAVCEREGVACISVDTPASAWLSGGPYNNSWHAFFDNERELLAFLEAWESIDTNKRIGLMTANDSEGVEISTFIHDFANAKGYTVIDPGCYSVGMVDYSDEIESFAKCQCDIIMGVMNPEDFSRFWKQLRYTDYLPKMCTIAKASLFETDVMSLGELGDGLVTEIWWNENFPYKSSITGQSSSEIAQDYLRNYATELNIVPPTVGYKHANVEILYDILKRAASLDLDKINKAAAETNLSTIVGNVKFDSDHVARMGVVTGQWKYSESEGFSQDIIGNYLVPDIKITAPVRVLGE